MAERFRSYMGPGACLFRTRPFFCAHHTSLPVHPLSIAGDKDLPRANEVRGYQPVSRIGEVVMNAFVDAVRCAAMLNPQCCRTLRATLTPARFLLLYSMSTRCCRSRVRRATCRRRSTSELLPHFAKSDAAPNVDPLFPLPNLDGRPSSPA